MLILDLWGISFHAVIVFGLDKNLLLKSILGHCVRSLRMEITILNCSFLVRTSKVIEVQAHILACGSVNAKLKSQSHSIEKWVTHIGAKSLFEVAFHFSKIFLPVLHGCSKWPSILDVSKFFRFFGHNSPPFQQFFTPTVFP